TPGLVSFANQIYSISFYQWYPSLGFSQNYPHADGQILKRIEPRPDWTPERLLAVLGTGAPKPLPYAANPAADNSWTPAWGIVTSTPAGLALIAKPSTTGAYTILEDRKSTL